MVKRTLLAKTQDAKIRLMSHAAEEHGKRGEKRNIAAGIKSVLNEKKE